MRKNIGKKPKLRFPEFQGDWSTQSMSSVFDRVLEKNKVNNKNVLTISAQHGLVKQGSYFNKSVSSSNLEGYYLLRKGDFAYNKSYSSDYPMGAIKLLTKYEAGVVSPLYICFREKKGNSCEFYSEYFESGLLNRYIAKISQEGARNHGLLNMSVHDFFSDVYLNLPTRLEQEKISTFLITVNDWIDNLKAQKLLLDKYKLSIFQKVFSQKFRFKDEDGRNYSNWVEKRLGDLFSERNEKNGGKDLELLSVKIHGGVVPQGDTNKTDSSNSDKSKYKVVMVGDIAYNTMRMWQGASGVSQYEGIVSPAYTVVYPKKGDVNFYGYLFKHPRTIFNFYRYSQGLTSDTWNLKFKHFSEVEVTVPSDIEEQKKIATFLSSLDELIEHKEKQISLAEQWKKGLLQQMFV